MLGSLFIMQSLSLSELSMGNGCSPAGTVRACGRHIARGFSRRSCTASSW